MPEATKIISDASATRFQYGTTTSVEGESVFYGAVIFGTELWYDPISGEPISGTVQRIELQTRYENGINDVHGSYSDIGADAHQLNNAFLGADAPWFDPIQFFETTHVANLAVGESGDSFTGSECADTLDGNGGHDGMYGGNSGSDTFGLDLTSEDNSDSIARDFDVSEDNLYLDTGDILTSAEMMDIFTSDALTTDNF